jgi:Protein of unknown function (DUF2281)
MIYSKKNMTVEQVLLEKWRGLPPQQQQEVMDFVEFLESKQAVVKTENQPKNQPQLRSLLGDRLWKIRAEIVASGTPLLNWEGVEQEKAERRVG